MNNQHKPNSMARDGSNSPIFPLMNCHVDVFDETDSCVTCENSILAASRGPDRRTLFLNEANSTDDTSKTSPPASSSPRIHRGPSSVKSYHTSLMQRANMITAVRELHDARESRRRIQAESLSLLRKRTMERSGTIQKTIHPSLKSQKSEDIATRIRRTEQGEYGKQQDRAKTKNNQSGRKRIVISIKPNCSSS
mmetsp:Transcript_7972/g.10682  ORF Transcript_7972/g.10682 Transcript_7972/m.10682 type:complete len:194 (+) Transcript_7972:71-652(+)